MEFPGVVASVWGGSIPILRARVGTIAELRLDERDQSRLRVSTNQGIWELRSAPERIFVEGFGN